MQDQVEKEAAESRTQRNYEIINEGIKWSKSKLILLDRKDPMEVFEELQRNKAMKKESLQRAFIDDAEEEENKKLVNMLETLYENHELVRDAM